jgi:hypothetical protein
MFARCSALAVFLAIASCIALADETPRPPQPPLTRETLREWRDDLTALSNLRDNAFLYEEAASDLNRRLLAWQGADVVLSLRVASVTQEQVICHAPSVSQVTVQNQQQPLASRQPSDQGQVALRIGDVVPLDVARTLREGDTVVVDGKVVTSNFVLRGGLRLSIEHSGVVAVVSRSFAGNRTRGQLNDFIPVPDYPIEALVSGADGEAVVKVAQDKVSLTRGTGNFRLDETVLNSMKRLENNTHLFPGEHRFRFEILAR